MKVLIKDLKETAEWPIEASRPAVEFGLTGWDFLPVSVKGVAREAEGRVRIVLNIGTGIRLACGRCIKRIDRPLAMRLELDEPLPEQSLDLAPAIREEVLLAVPLYPLCREDCRGLCVTCGADLNEGPCACPEETRAESRSEVLKWQIQKSDIPPRAGTRGARTGR